MATLLQVDRCLRRQAFTNEFLNSIINYLYWFVHKLRMSAIRQNFHAECENAINQQINNELASSYFYLSIAFHFDRDDVALANFHKYFCKMSDKKKENAEKFIKYMNERGGRVKFSDIPTPGNNFGEPYDIMKCILDYEKKVYKHMFLLSICCNN